MRVRVSQGKVGAVKHSAVDRGSGECNSPKDRRLFAGRWRAIILWSSTILDHFVKMS
ncbi:hypothetical protein TRIATDRAFT_256715 [Trichoderma atroviride IMI 206040]|uniref:Uncharacterized protein n=1 Tax=Hypocrea atroviridis (strain ATCC 20476 / IMI 206040) TaxID=452589 RepID=G9NUP8_HYPAI|nr:uncharacterized protein TRIATDRAFT_256715 [Trichoderma atroviride IMI 206040]EHK45773.1 hypothetical protein TRIATDRAFT_256715 [Trichoderma atroviride IMI 206040]